jgi:hypothetical protein
MTAVRWVGQGDAGGCGPATLAMLTGCTYEEAKDTIDSLAWVKHGSDGATRQSVDWSDGGGMSTYHLDRCLYAHGYFKQTHYAAWGHDLTQPFAPLHYAMVRQPSNNHHFVAMLADGTVLDPMREGEYRLSDWPEVVQVCGLVTP